MKKLFAICFSVVLMSSVMTAQTAPSVAPEAPAVDKMSVPVGGAVLTFEKTEIDYGNIEKGADPLRKFKFKNTGTEPLVIQSAQGSCGCTVPSYKKEPILPGESSEIEVRYDTQRVGPFQKQVTLTTNESVPTRVLTIKGVVADKKVEEALPTNAPAIFSAPKQ
jgi:hypothetical protein